MKIIDKRKGKKQRQRNKRVAKAIVKVWFCFAFKLGFIQLLCKATLILKSNLELALSNILKERELYKSKRVEADWRRNV